MAKTIERLSETKVRTLTKPGKYADGGNGLYLRITQGAHGAAKSWVFRYRFPPRAKGGGKQRDLGLGTPAKYNLETVRGIVAEYWRMIERGEDPMARRQAAASAHTKAHTYAEAAEKFIEAKRPGWHPRHATAGAMMRVEPFQAEHMAGLAGRLNASQALPDAECSEAFGKRMAALGTGHRSRTAAISKTYALPERSIFRKNVSCA